MSESLLYKKEGAVGVLQINRPQRKNSLDSKLRIELRERLLEIGKDKGVRAVIITGGEEMFCAGADINEISSESKRISAETEYERAREFQSAFDAIEQLPQPVIAAIGGFAVGGGCELTLACDFRIASENAIMGLPEVKVGAFPAAGGTQRLPRLIGVAKAKEMILTGEVLKAQQALALGLVTKVVPQGSVVAEGKAFAAKFAVLPRLSVQAAKMLINRGTEIELGTALELEARTAGSVGTSHDFREGFLAFLEKRKPDFTGD
jgi:enoyl-CoA hydratase